MDSKTAISSSSNMVITNRHNLKSQKKPGRIQLMIHGTSILRDQLRSPKLLSIPLEVLTHSNIVNRGTVIHIIVKLPILNKDSNSSTTHRKDVMVTLNNREIHIHTIINNRRSLQRRQVIVLPIMDLRTNNRESPLLLRKVTVLPIKDLRPSKQDNIQDNNKDSNHLAMANSMEAAIKPSPTVDLNNLHTAKPTHITLTSSSRSKVDTDASLKETVSVMISASDVADLHHQAEVLEGIEGHIAEDLHHVWLIASQRRKPTSSTNIRMSHKRASPLPLTTHSLKLQSRSPSSNKISSEALTLASGESETRRQTPTQLDYVVR